MKVPLLNGITRPTHSINKKSKVNILQHFRIISDKKMASLRLNKMSTYLSIILFINLMHWHAIRILNRVISSHFFHLLSHISPISLYNAARSCETATNLFVACHSIANTSNENEVREKQDFGHSVATYSRYLK